MVPESRVTTLALELVVRHEESLRAGHAGVHAYVFGPPVIACVGSLVAYLLRHMVLHWCQPVSERVLAHLKMLGSPRLERAETWPSSVLTFDLMSLGILLSRHFLCDPEYIMDNCAVTLNTDIV